MSNEIKPIDNKQELSIIEGVLVKGDLSKLTNDQRVLYYRLKCESYGLNYLSRPFDYLELHGKIVLYPNRTAADELRFNHSISIKVLSREMHANGLYEVRVAAGMPNGRLDESSASLNTVNKKGDDLANALMKCETKAKRRVTLSITGLAGPDESELHSIAGAKPVKVDFETGEIIDIGAPSLATLPPPQKALEAPVDAKEVERLAICFVGMKESNDMMSAFQLIAKLSVAEKRIFIKLLNQDEIDWATFISKNPPSHPAMA